MIAELLYYAASFSAFFILALIGVLTFDRQARAEFIQEVTK